MADVKRSVVISGEQDKYLSELRKTYGLTRSHGVRMALEKLMRDPPFFLATNLANSKEQAHSESVEEVAR